MGKKKLPEYEIKETIKTISNPEKKELKKAKKLLLKLQEAR